MLQLTLLAMLGIWLALAYTDYKHLSLSNSDYLGSVVGMLTLILIGFWLNFKIAFVSAIIGGAIYYIMRWYLTKYTTATDSRLILLSLIGFPLPSVIGIATLSIRGMVQGKKYYPALLYFGFGFMVATAILLIA